MNDENAYNLINEPWIPVLMRDGTNRSVSLGEVFADAGGTIADLALNPYERVAVFRLLLCIAQAALGPERLKDEAGWLSAKNAVGPVSVDYLRKWHDRFFLYGPHAFLQPDEVKLQEPKKTTNAEETDTDGAKIGNASISKLCLARSSGNNSTLFDHGASDPNRTMVDSERVVCLLVFQSFSSGGRFSQCIWDGSLAPANGSAYSSPCRESDMLFSIMLGDNLLDSVWLNLLTKNMLDSAEIDWGFPVWECDKLSRTKLQPLGFSYLGHLVPFSRIVKQVNHESQIILGEGVVYPTLCPDQKNPGKRPFGWREPMASVKQSRDNVPCYVASDPTHLPWRELASILAVHTNSGSKAAFALHHRDTLQEEKEFVLWTGGLCTDQAKDVCTVEWSARLSALLLEDPMIQQYQHEIQHADRQSMALYFACKTYALTVKTSDPTKAVKKSKEVEIVSPYSIPAQRMFWDVLASSDNQKLVLDVDSPTYKDDWRKATRKAAEDAYRRACPAMTARQMEAFAQGFSKLTIREERTNE